MELLEAKAEEAVTHFSEHETQSEGYASINLCKNNEKLPFVYESTGDV